MRASRSARASRARSPIESVASEAAGVPFWPLGVAVTGVLTVASAAGLALAVALGVLLALRTFVAAATEGATAALGVAELGGVAAVVAGAAVAAVPLGEDAGWLGDCPVAICARSAIESPGAGATPTCGFCSGLVQ